MILRSHGNTPSRLGREITPPCEITPSGVKSQSPVKSHPHMRSHGTPQTLKWHDSHTRVRNSIRPGARP